MGTTLTWILFLVLGLSSTCCLALPRRGGDDFPKPVLPQPLEKAGTLNTNRQGESADTRDISKQALLVQNTANGSPVVTPLLFSNPILDSVKKVWTAIKLVEKLNAPFSAGSGDNGFMKKMEEYWESFRIVKQIRDRCSDDETKHDVSCTDVRVHGFYDLFGETWNKIESFVLKWYTPISKRVTEIKEQKEDYKTTKPGGTTIVTKKDTYFSSFIYFLDMFGLDGKPEVVYEKEKGTEKGAEEEENKGPTKQEIKDNALLYAVDGFDLIHKIEKHDYWTKSVNAAIKLAGLGIFGALCAQNCGFENLFGAGTPPPPLDPEDEAANLAAAVADAAGDTDGDNDVDADDGRRRDDIIADDSYHGYVHDGEYKGYDLQQPHVQPEQKNSFIDGKDPGYAYGTFPGWYPPEVNVNNNNNNNNNHLVEPEQHPDFSSRVLHSRDFQPQPIHEDAVNDDHSSAVFPGPVFRGGRMLQENQDPK